MIGIVDVGGGNRGSYGAGVMDYFMKKHISFDYGIGVSAGSANIIAYFADQYRRNIRFYAKYNLRKEAMSFSNLLKNGSYVNLDYIFGTLSNADGEDPLDFQAFAESGKMMKIVATDAYTGRPVYFDAREMRQNDYGAIKASSSVPGMNEPYRWHGGAYFDGAISDPIPVGRALRDGCSKVLVILTRPRNFVRKPDQDRLLAARMRRKYPKAAQAFASRAKVYNAQLERCKQLEKKGIVRILAPDTIGKMKTLGQSADAIKMLYRKGYRDASSVLSFLDKD